MSCSRPFGLSIAAAPRASFGSTVQFNLWRLLETIARRKMLKRVEKLGAAKRDPKREEYPEGDIVPGQGPAPEEAAIAADLIENVLAGLDESYVSVFNLRLQRYTEEKTAAKLNCSRWSVTSKLKHIRERLRRLSGEKEKK